MEAQMNRAIRTVLALLACASVLAGCQIAPPSISTSNIPPRTMPLLGGRVVVAAPQGYCIDQDSLQDHRKSGFVLMAGCDGLMGLPSGTMIEPAILTVAAFLPDQPYKDPLDVARALEGIEVLDQREVGGMTVLHLHARDIVPEHSAAEHWRGAMVVNGAILTLAVYGNDAIAGEAGARLLQGMGQQIQTASLASAQLAPTKPRKKTKNLFQRIFN
jgi:hypothetical protein